MSFLDTVLGMILPRVCAVCGRELVEGESTLCLHCMGQLGEWVGDREAMRLQRLPRTAPIVRVASWLTYSNEGVAGQLIRHGKYDGRPELILALSRMYARWLADRRLLDDVDVLVPVPMHWLKRMRRGFNQAEIIAQTLARESGTECGNLLRATRSHRSQTHNSAEGRAANVLGMFEISPKAPSLAGKHVGIVDDILTTGATLSEAVKVLAGAGARAISIYTLAAVKS